MNLQVLIDTVFEDLDARVEQILEFVLNGMGALALSVPGPGAARNARRAAVSTLEIDALSAS